MKFATGLAFLILVSNAAFAARQTEVLSIDKCVLEVSRDKAVDLDNKDKSIDYINLNLIDRFRVTENSKQTIARGKKKYEIRIGKESIETDDASEMRTLKSAVIQCINK
ncbi:hypothetical protein [Motilimonas eburnea]|uniref:hypothetical protein n=1 Tax=Motilimonas eburnea TaxID=1737488 RepID=UPI001E64229A|nr:hypothetical protein [Motilimonas eburnea]MCE2571869.1 hypothetical protein [Motilimonas eburnea]